MPGAGPCPCLPPRNPEPGGLESGVPAQSAGNRVGMASPLGPSFKQQPPQSDNCPVWCQGTENFSVCSQPRLIRGFMKPLQKMVSKKAQLCLGRCWEHPHLPSTYPLSHHQLSTEAQGGLKSAGSRAKLPPRLWQLFRQQPQCMAGR